MAQINRIDTKFLRDEFCGVFHVVNNDIHSLVEVGSTLSVPPTLQYLKEHNIDLAAIKNIFITHVHLDHSGGAGLLLQSLPNATIYAHSAGVAHIVNPLAKLVPGAVEVYGQQVFDVDYPGIVGAPASRVKALAHQQTVDGFTFLEAHGHAYHHGMFLFAPQKTLFTGDGFGFGFQQINMCPLLCTSPTQFDAAVWAKTVEMVKALDVDFIQPTHFDRFSKEQFEKLFESVERQLSEYQAIIMSSSDKEQVKAKYVKVIKEELERFGCDKVELAYGLIYGDINVDGLWFRVTRLKK